MALMRANQSETAVCYLLALLCSHLSSMYNRKCPEQNKQESYHHVHCTNEGVGERPSSLARFLLPNTATIPLPPSNTAQYGTVMDVLDPPNLKASSNRQVMKPPKTPWPMYTKHPQKLQILCFRCRAV